jgi:hypothetical protein
MKSRVIAENTYDCVNVMINVSFIRQNVEIWEIVVNVNHHCLFAIRLAVHANNGHLNDSVGVQKVQWIPPSWDAL